MRTSDGPPAPAPEEPAVVDPAPLADRVYTAVLADPADDRNRFGVAMRRVHLAWADEAKLARQARAEVEHAFAVADEKGIEGLYADLERTEKMRMFFQDPADSSETAQLWRNLLPFAEGESERAAATVAEACAVAEKEVRDAAAKAELDVQKAAQATAVTAMNVAWKEIQVQATRYLNVGEGARSTYHEILDPDVPVMRLRLQGPDVAALIGALRTVQERRRRAVGTAQTATKSPNANTLAEAESAAADLAQCVAAHAMDHPVLLRVWRDVPDLPAFVTVRPARTPSGEPVENTVDTTTTAVVVLRDLVATALRVAWAANAEFYEELLDASVVWRFPPLIERTLAAMGEHDPSLTTRAVARRADRLSLDDVVKWLSTGASLTQTLTAMMGAAPGVNVVLLALSVSLSTAEHIAEFHRRRRNNAAALAVLDPRQAIAAQDGYAGLIVDVAFTVLDLPDLAKVLRAVRAAAPGPDLALEATTKLVAP